MAEVVAVCISNIRGTKKTQVSHIDVKSGYGIVGDAHAGDWHRQVSLLAQESIDKMTHLGFSLKPGDFAENIVTKGLELSKLSIGSIIDIGSTSLRVTQIGKKCHNDCEIKKLVGQCVMPTEGIFTEVLKDGRISPNDNINVREV